MDIQLTAGQEQALEMVGELLDSKKPVYGVLCGYAGTGKTTLLKTMARQLGSPPLVVCPTGKAAVRVKEATGLEASTIHRYIYKVIEDPKTGAVQWVPKDLLELHRPACGLLVVDEASMVSDTVWRDLWRSCEALDVRVLLVGDLFQLPPVNPENKDFSTLTSLATDYRTNLTEVVRQALDSPIIRASMLIRKSAEDALDALDLLPTIKEKDLVNTFLGLDPRSRAMLAWTNKARRRLNAEVRGALGMEKNRLGDGEPLLVTYNNYELDRYNGEVVTFDNWVKAPGEQVAVKDFYKQTAAMVGYGAASVEGATMLLSQDEVLGATAELSAKAVAKAGKRYAREGLGYAKGTEPSHLNADLGYCLTVHKSQGSEYDDVVVVVEPGRDLQSYEGRRWWYTGITRSRHNLSLCFVD